MKQFGIAAIVAVVVAGALYLFVVQPRIETLERQIASTQTQSDDRLSQLNRILTLKKVVRGSSHILNFGTCKGFTTSKLTAVVGDTIEWNVGDFNDCLRGGWRLEYRFQGGASPVDPPVPTGTLAGTHSTMVVTATAVTAGKFKYDLYRVKGNGSGMQEQKLEDPEIEIEPPPPPVIKD